jgi:hypothetical protein
VREDHPPRDMGDENQLARIEAPGQGRAGRKVQKAHAGGRHEVRHAAWTTRKDRYRHRIIGKGAQ